MLFPKRYHVSLRYLIIFSTRRKMAAAEFLDGCISNSTSISPCNCIECRERNGGSFERGSKRRKQGANTKVLWNSYKARGHKYQCEACRISRPHPSSPRTSSVFPSSPRFFIVLSCRDLPVRKPTPRRILNAAVGHACRRLRLYCRTLFSPRKTFFFPRLLKSAT